MKLYSRMLDLLEKICRAAIAFMFCVMTVVMIYQVIMRYVFNSANAWSEEIARYLFIYIVLLASFLAVRRYSHLQVDVFINMLRPRLKCLATIVCTLAGMVFLAVLTYAGFSLCQSITHSVSPALKLSMVYFYAAIPLGGILMFLASIEVVFHQASEYRRLTKEEVKA